jgi:hypothetical protein
MHTFATYVVGPVGVATKAPMTREATNGTILKNFIICYILFGSKRL